MAASFLISSKKECVMWEKSKVSSYITGKNGAERGVNRTDHTNSRIQFRHDLLASRTPGQGQGAVHPGMPSSRRNRSSPWWRSAVDQKSNNRKQIKGSTSKSLLCRVSQVTGSQVTQQKENVLLWVLPWTFLNTSQLAISFIWCMYYHDHAHILFLLCWFLFTALPSQDQADVADDTQTQ